MSGNPWPRLSAPVRAASAVISVNTVVPSPSRRAAGFIADRPSPTRVAGACASPAANVDIIRASEFFIDLDHLLTPEPPGLRGYCTNSTLFTLYSSDVEAVTRARS